MEIIVLCGGESDERAVSLCSGERVTAALRNGGHRVIRFDYQGGRISPSLVAALRHADAIFLALHGGAGEDGTLQRELETQGIFHYSGSAPDGAALAMQKDAAKICVAAYGVPVAKGVILADGSEPPPLSFPLVIKPPSGGSSVGLRFIQDAYEWKKINPLEGLLCEQYLPGKEYTVGVLNGTALPAVEIRPIGGAYDYEHKYTPGASEELCPAPLSSSEAMHLAELALTAFSALGLRDYARIDFREDGSGIPHFLEANTLPGMTETSLLPLAARAAGIEFPALCEKMAVLAAKRKKE